MALGAGLDSGFTSQLDPLRRFYEEPEVAGRRILGFLRAAGFRV